MKRYSVAMAWLASCLAAACEEAGPTAPLGDAEPAFLIADAAHDSQITGFYFLPPLVRNPETVGNFDAGRSPRVEICTVLGAEQQPPAETETPAEEEAPAEDATTGEEDTTAEGSGAVEEEPPLEEEPPPDDTGDKGEEPPIEEEFPPDDTGGKGVTGGCGTAAIAIFAMDGVHVQLHPDHYQVDWRTADFDLDPALTYRIWVMEGTDARGFADVDVVGSGSELRSVDTGEYIPLLDGRTLPIRFRLEVGI